jgi:hypothetical protein
VLVFGMVVWLVLLIGELVVVAWLVLGMVAWLVLLIGELVVGAARPVSFAPLNKIHNLIFLI